MRLEATVRKIGRNVAAVQARGLAAKRRARLGDALIAESCLDHDVHLITRDRDFQLFARAAGLKITT